MRKNATHRSVVRAILAWYKRHGRTLPWRNISNPYRILVSEIMLQQTQVSRVIAKYPAFLRRFPTLNSLARATRREVILAWQGMGYNNRAVRLHDCARVIIGRHNGRIPGRYDDLIRLPGIGSYTAHALLASIYRHAVPVVDVNVQRVLSRVFWRMLSLDASVAHRDVAALAHSILPQRKAYDWNQALMDLGATVCTARSPRCSTCPVARWCSSRAHMARDAVLQPKHKVLRNDLPNRIYRGRVVEYLRGSRRSVRADALAGIVRPRFSTRHEQWFLNLLQGLEKDGLIRIRWNGSLSSARVSLA